MLMLEKEAAEKRCTLALPLMLLCLSSENKLNEAQATFPDIHTRCIGSRCAQWRWYDQPDADGNSWFYDDAQGGAYTHRGKREKSGSVKGVRAPARGFCGLAGRIE